MVTIYFVNLLCIGEVIKSDFNINVLFIDPALAFCREKLPGQDPGRDTQGAVRAFWSEIIVTELSPADDEIRIQFIFIEITREKILECTFNSGEIRTLDCFAQNFIL